jgi:apolipoprotein N-acyltransferase
MKIIKSLTNRLASNFFVGGFGALGFAPFQIIPAFLFSVGWFFKNNIAENGVAKKILLESFAFFLGFHMFCLYWMVYPLTIDITNHWILIPFTILIPAYLSIQLVVPVFVTIKYCNGTYEKIFGFSALFCIVTYFYGHCLPGFPWILPGYIWNLHEVFMQTLSLFGIYGLSFITIVISCFCGTAYIFYEKKDGKNMMLASGIPLALVLAMVTFGIWKLCLNKTKYTHYKARVVQCNILQSDKMNNSLSLQNLNKHISYSKHGTRLNFIIWPEAAIPYLYHEQFTNLHNYLRSPLKIGEYLISGTVRKDLSTTNIYNSAVIINHEGRNICNYDKIRLVLFGEYIPFRKYIPFQSIASDIGDFDIGKLPSSIQISGLKITMAICYEAVFPNFAPQCDETDVIINLTNDAWFGFTTEPFQHLQIVRARSVETGLPLIRATNYGISAVFDSWGREINRIKINNCGVMDFYIPQKTANTPYNRAGDSIFFIFISASAVYAFRRRKHESL